MTEIWVPYGPVEVSFDIKQENLSQILEPQPQKIGPEELEKTADLVSEDSVILLSGSTGTQKVLDVLLTRNKGIRKILHPKNLGALARRKAQEFMIEAEPLNFETLVDAGLVDGVPAMVPSQLKSSNKLLILTSLHYDPLYGISSSASDIVSLVPALKEQAFKRSMDEIPCIDTKSNASWYSARVLQSCSKINVLEVIEKTATGVLAAFYGDCESTHARALEFWTKALSIELPAKAERVIFGCGGHEGDRTLTDALARSFFQVVSKVALQDSEAKICMLAECSQGLGSEALLRFVTGKYEPRAKLDAVSYFDGLEVLLSFYKVQRDLQLSILTTLPNYYASKFEFKTIGGARQAPASLVQIGSRAKILVATDAATTYFAT